MNLSFIQSYTTGPSGVITIINSYLVPLIIAIAFLMFLFGIARAYIFSGGDESKRKEGHQFALWGIIGFVIMISVWGLVNMAQSTLIPSSANTTAPKPPTL
ncbi:MAG: hypothetical protein WAN50_00760 [Minisyncoccia bacterium]